MKKAVWLASVLGLAVAAWATTGDVSVEDMGSYASQQGDSDAVARRHHGSSGGSSSYGSSGGGGRRHRNRGSSGGSSGGSRG